MGKQLNGTSSDISFCLFGLTKTVWKIFAEDFNAQIQMQFFRSMLIR